MPDILQGSKNLFSITRQGGSKRKVLVAKVAVKLKFQSPNRQMHYWCVFDVVV